MRRRHAPLFGAIATLTIGLLAIPAASIGSPARVERLTAISGKTPFPDGCGAEGNRTPSSEAEPHIAVAPGDPRHLVATWQQDRFVEDGGAHSNLVATSRDGGRTWRDVRLPGVSKCTGGSHDRTSDPWVSIGPDGMVYAASLRFDLFPVTGIGSPTAQAVNVSNDGGFSFAPAVTTVDENLYDDREAVTADPTRPGHAYITWVRRYGALGESGIEYFSRTADGGTTWSEPAPIQETPSGTFPTPTLIEVLPDGALLNFFLLVNGTPVAKESVPETPLVPWEVMATRSTDQGASWSEPVRIGVIVNPVAPHDPDSGATVRAYPVISTAVGRDGTAYVVWNEIESESSSRIFLARSIDGGRSFEPPALVANPSTQAFLPNVAVARGGTIGVTWDDFRNDVRGDDELTTDVFFAHSHDNGQSWRQIHLAGPFDMLTAPPTTSTEIAGRFVGDYQGLAALADGFGALFAQAKPRAREGPSDVFFGQVVVGELPRIRLTVRPRRARLGRRSVFRFRASARPREGRRRRALSGVRIRFAGRTLRTNRRGRALTAVTFRSRGLKRAVATKRGFTSRVVRVRVR